MSEKLCTAELLNRTGQGLESDVLGSVGISSCVVTRLLSPNDLRQRDEPRGVFFSCEKCAEATLHAIVGPYLQPSQHTPSGPATKHMRTAAILGKLRTRRLRGSDTSGVHPLQGIPYSDDVMVTCRYCGEITEVLLGKEKKEKASKSISTLTNLCSYRTLVFT